MRWMHAWENSFSNNLFLFFIWRCFPFHHRLQYTPKYPLAHSATTVFPNCWMKRKFNSVNGIHHYKVIPQIVSFQFLYWDNRIFTIGVKEHPKVHSQNGQNQFFQTAESKERFNSVWWKSTSQCSFSESFFQCFI